MPRNNVRADSRFQKAVEYQIKNPNLTVYDSMKLADFSLREREDKAKYMMVLRLLNKTKKDDFVTPPAQLSITTVSRSSSDLISFVTAVPTTSMCRRFGQSHMWLVCTGVLTIL